MTTLVQTVMMPSIQFHSQGQFWLSLHVLTIPPWAMATTGSDYVIVQAIIQCRMFIIL
jgi:hypothetical protein